MPASSSDKISRTSTGDIPAVATVTASRAPGVTSLSVDTQLNWPTSTGIKFSTFKVDTSNKKVENSQIDWRGVSNGTNGISNIQRTGGAVDTGNVVGDKVVMLITAQWGQDLADALLLSHSQTGALLPSAVQAAIGTGGIATAAIADLAVTAAKLGLTFTTGVNSGSAGGDTNYLTLGSLKIMWGTTASQNINANGTAALTVNFPVAFNSTTGLMAGPISAAELLNNADQNVYRDISPTTTTLSIAFRNGLGGNGTGIKALWFAIGN